MNESNFDKRADHERPAAPSPDKPLEDLDVRLSGDDANAIKGGAADTSQSNVGIFREPTKHPA